LEGILNHLACGAGDALTAVNIATGYSHAVAAQKSPQEVFSLASQLPAAARYTLELADHPRAQIQIRSPGEVRVYDSQGRTSGVFDGEVHADIPYSAIEGDVVTIFSPCDVCTYEVAGTNRGSYGIVITRIAGSDAAVFKRSTLPITDKAIHRYRMDWTNSDERASLEIYAAKPPAALAFQPLVLADSPTDGPAGPSSNVWTLAVVAAVAAGVGALISLLFARLILGRR
jgi:hypothetical protein